MSVQQLDLEEFRGIRKCKEPIKFSKFSILIGRNNSGKSTILGALYLLPFPYHHKEPFSQSERITYLQGLVGGKSSLVYAYSGKAKLTYRVNSKEIKIEINDGGTVEKFTMNGEELDPYRFRSIAKLFNVEEQIEKLQKLVFFIPNSTGFVRMLTDNLKQDTYWNYVMKQRAHVRVASQINECIDDKYTEVLPYKDALCARKEIPGTGPIYIKIADLGDGIEKAVAIMLFANAYNPHIILWDDFETTAHPTLIRMLLNWLKEGQWQVILSTHSIDVLSRLLEVKPKDAKVIQLKKTADDVLLYQELSLEELEDIMEANQDPRLLVDALQL